jgi:hypothetical protein
MGLSNLKVEMYTIRGEKISSEIISGEKQPGRVIKFG